MNGGGEKGEVGGIAPWLLGIDTPVCTFPMIAIVNTGRLSDFGDFAATNLLQTKLIFISMMGL